MPINYSYTPPQNRELLFFIALSSLIYLFLIYCSWVSKYPSIWILIHSQKFILKKIHSQKLPNLQLHKLQECCDSAPLI